MYVDKYGQVVFQENDLCNLLYQNCQIDLTTIMIENPEVYNNSNKKLHAGLPTIKKYQNPDLDLNTFDSQYQNNWYMPDDYKNFDIESWLYQQCRNSIAKERVTKELELFQQTNLLNLLKYLKYLVDTMNSKKILWGVGRGSSTASYILYLIGLHMVDPIRYDIPIEEFFKQGKQNV